MAALSPRAMVARYLGRRLRGLVLRMTAAVAPDAAELPDVVSALRRLVDAVDADLPAGRGHRLVSREVSKKKVQNKLNWVRRRLAKAEAELLALRQARERDGAHRLTSEFVAKVALAAPSASERFFADAWADLIGAGAAGCSRRTIGRVRDAFSDVVNELYLKQVEESAQRARAARLLAVASSPAAALAPGAACAPSRGRSSKVLQHSVWASACALGRGFCA